jgi:hypothetical protein
MIKFAIDYSTARRLTGWAYDDKTGSPVKDLFVTDGQVRVLVPMIRRHDVAGTFGLKNDEVGFDLNVPDCFDRAVADYSLVVDDMVIYNYSRAIGDVERSLGLGASQESAPDNSIDYSTGRHVIFLHPGSGPFSAVVQACRDPRFAAQMPAMVSGVRISDVILSRAGSYKAAMLANSRNIIVITESVSYPALSAVSPTLVQDARFVTLYRDGSLTTPLGLHNFQLNAFFDAKSLSLSCGNEFLRTILRIRTVTEYYADLLFSANQKTFFLSDDSLVNSPILNAYIRDRVQGVRKEDIIKVHYGDSSVTVVNLSAYVRIFDKLGKADCWAAAIARGLTKGEVHLQ